MDKTSRKSGGNAWKNPSEKLAQTIGFVNSLGEVINNAGVKLPKIPEYTNNFETEYLRSSFEPEMRRLKIILSMVSRELLEDILSYSPYFATRNIDEIIEALGNGDQLFSPKITERGGIGDFYRCMSRLDNLISFYYLLRVLITKWENERRQFEDFIRDKNSDLYPFQLRSAQWNDFELIKINSDRKIKLMYTEPIVLIDDIEIERLRICPKCNEIFWAGRINMIGCSKCAPALRKKKWRDSIPPKQKLQYNQNRRKKRENRNTNSEVETELSALGLIEPVESFEEYPFPEIDRVSRVGEIEIKNGKEYVIVEERDNLIITNPVKKKEETIVRKLLKKILKNNS